MVTKLTMYKIQATVPAGETSITAFSKAIRGRIHSIKVIYSNTTPVSSSDRDVNLWEMNPADPDDTSDALQEILDIGGLGADPSADNAVYYPETPVQDYQGVAIDLSDAQGGDTAKYDKFEVFGKVMLQVTAAAVADITTIYLLVEEY